MNIQTVLNQASKILNNSSNAPFKLDSEILLSEVIKKNRQYLILNSNEELKKENIKLFNHLLKRSSAIFASSVTYLIPIVAIAWGVFDGENILLQHLIGAAIILLGVYLVNKKETTP